MNARDLHPWDLGVEAAIRTQRRLAGLVVAEDQIPSPVQYIAGVDVSGPDAEGFVTGVVVVLRYPELTVVEQQTARHRPEMPYIPGLLSFRESPAILEACAQVRTDADLMLVDGQGIAHPRRLGIAAHLGVLLDLPAIGCAKSRLTGAHDPVPEDVGAWVPLTDGGEVIGAVIRTKPRVKPLYVSIGHRVDLAAAVRWTLACTRGYRLPEPTRLADRVMRVPAAAGPAQSRLFP